MPSSEEFGHISARGKGVFIDSWGVGPYEITVGDKAFRFEDSDRFGPTPIGDDGEPTGEYFRQRSPFWKAWKMWVKQGRMTAEDGITCIWSA